MPRSFPTRFPNSLTRTVLLAPCLLVCLACATPLPLDDLEKGMTTEAVRAEFGEPAWTVESTHPIWNYFDEKQNWGGTVYCVLIAPMCAVLSPISLLDEGRTLFHVFGVGQRPVALYFEANKLDRWAVGSFPTGKGQPISSGAEALHRWMQNSATDYQHHAQGHKHHHDDC